MRDDHSNIEIIEKVNKIKIEQDHEIEHCLREGLRNNSLGKGTFETKYLKS